MFAHGGFHIWPKGEQEGKAENAAAEATPVVDAIGQDHEVAAPAIPETHGFSDTEYRLKAIRATRSACSSASPTGHAPRGDTGQAGRGGSTPRRTAPKHILRELADTHHSKAKLR